MKRFLILPALLALAACGGGSSSSSNQNPGTPDAGSKLPAPTIASFTASPDSLPYGGGSVTLSWSVSGASTVSISPDVGEVTGQSSATVNVTQAKSFTLTATNATGSVTASAAVSVAEAMTVSGTVVDFYGRPVPSASVLIGSHPVAIADASGQFSIGGVVAPYDVAVVGPDQQNIVVYEGLTASQLTLTLVGDSKAKSSAGLAGSVSGGSTPYDTNRPAVAFASADVGGVIAVTDTYGQFGFTVDWASTGSTTGSLFAFQPTVDGSGNITGWPYFGRTDSITLNPSSNTSSLSVSLSQVASAPLGGQVNAPGGYTLGTQRVIAQFQPYGAFQLFSNSSGSTSFGFNVPMVPNGSYAVVATAIPPTQVNNAASEAVVIGLTPGSTSASLTVPTVPSLGAPVDQANAVDANTSFSWSGSSTGAVYDLMAERNDGNGSLEIDVVTSATTARLPDLSALGLALPSGVTFDWQVIAVAPFSGINEAASTTGLGKLLGLRRNGSIAQSDYRFFTTR